MYFKKYLFFGFIIFLTQFNFTQTYFASFKKLFWGHAIFKGPLIAYFYFSAYVLQQIIKTTKGINCPYSLAILCIMLGLKEANEAEKCNNLKAFNLFNPDQI